MPELFIGNISKQIQQFCYRIPERQGVIVQTIPIGGQIQVSPNGRDKDLSVELIDRIIGQHLAFGIVPAEEVSSKSHPFSGICYSIGKPITPDKLHEAMIEKETAIDEFGRQIRQEAAVAVNSQIEQTGVPLNKLEMSFEEEEPRGGYVDGLTHVAEGVRVMRDNVAPMRGRR